RVDGAGRRPRAAGRRGDPLRLRARLHPRRDGGLRRLHPGRWLEAGARAGTRARGRQGVHGEGRRHHALPVQHVRHPMTRTCTLLTLVVVTTACGAGGDDAASVPVAHVLSAGALEELPTLAIEDGALLCTADG